MLRHSRLFAVAVLLALTGAAHAADPSVAVLGVEAIDVPQDLAQQLTDALRQRVAATSGVKAIAGKDLVEIKMVFGCDAEAPACLANAGKSLGADKLLYGTLKKSGKSTTHVVVALKLLDVKTQAVEKFVNETVAKRELAAGSVTQSAGRWFAALVEVDTKPSLNVVSDPVGAAVAVDGAPAGRTPITLRDLSPGAHTVAISMSGRKTVTRTVELRPGGTHELSVTLEAESAVVVAKQPEPKPEPLITKTPEPTEVKPQPKGHPGRTAKVLALTSLATAVVAGAVAIYTWRTYDGLQGTAHDDLSAIARTRAPATADEMNFFAKPTCNLPPAYANVQGASSYNDHCSSGESYAAATTALWVVAGALAGTSVILYVVGDRQAAKAEREQPKSTAAIMRRSLKLSPVFSSQSGGLSASFEF